MLKVHIKNSLPLVLLLLMFLPASAQWTGIKGNGKVVRESRDLRNFDAISVGGSFDVFLRQGRSQSLVVEADENLLDIISTEVNNGTLKIKTEKNIQQAEKLNIFITVEDLRSLEVSGAADLIAEGSIYADDLKIKCSGSADVKLLDLRAENLACSASGSADIRLAGRAQSLTASMSGSSDLQARDFKTESCTLQLSGSSDAFVYASQSLTASASGSSDVHCYGSPEHRQVSSSGAADVNFP
ncbi:MAG: DUF2807 domain-containing protein [Bacteroidetes bacterium]|nr:MAG: DUF2807 domain-containing protein [Bacteroidota bacterium]